MIMPQLFNTLFNITRLHRVFCTNNASSKGIILSYIIFLQEKLKNYPIQPKNFCFLFFACFVFLLSHNTLHVMFYIYIYYWNTFQYVYSLKRPTNFYCRICTISCMIFKKNMFMEALCRSLFTKYVHCKPLLPFQINSE